LRIAVISSKTSRMSIEHVTRRHLDAGQPFLVRHESHPGLVLLMRACAAPRCPCTEVEVELLPHDAFEALNTDHPARPSDLMRAREPSSTSPTQSIS
jgi:hypothetical protein